MKKEIGGYFQLEELQGTEYYPDLYRVNLGRTALLWLLQTKGYKKIILPVFLCVSVTEICEENHIQIEFYHLGENLNVEYPRRKLEEDEVLYLVNYYGQLIDEQILEYRRIYGNIIVDHTHAFFQKPLPGIDTLYSCRKFWGVSDGAYLSTDVGFTGEIPQDYSADRMKHILGRYERDAGTYYKDMLKNAAGYEHMEIRRMSALTRNLLKGIDYEKAARKREENYEILAGLLGSDSVFNRVIPQAPFVYPYFHVNGPELRKRLAEHKIFVPVYWKNVMETCGRDSMEYHWAADILPLPCDQRYGPEEMEYMATVVKECEEIK